MNQFRLISLILVAGWLGGGGECRRVIWMQRASLADASSWEDGKAPCASDALLFPKQSLELMKLPSLRMKELVLPTDGGFVLAEQSSLQFVERDSSCSVNATKTFKGRIRAAWLSTDNWSVARITRATDQVTKATPHEQRLPCDHDEVIFPANSSFEVDLQAAPVLAFKSIAIDGRVMSAGEFREFLPSTFGRDAFKNAETTLFEEPQPCQDESRCACHRRNDALLEMLCANEARSCPSTAHCAEPIHPLGHCCDECGAMLQLPLDALVDFNLARFRSSVDKGKQSRGDLHDFRLR